MEGRRVSAKSSVQNSRLTSSAGKIASKTVGCQNCGAAKLSDCTCILTNTVASVGNIEQVSQKSPLGTVGLSQNCKEGSRIPLVKQSTLKPKSVASAYKSGSAQKQTKPLPEEDICLIHNKPLEVVCTKDLTIICSSCAIFGHKGHDFKSINEFQTDKLKRCQDILELTDAKKTFEDKVSSKASKDKIDRQFSKLKQQLIQQLKFKFRTLTELIQQTQERCLIRISKSVAQEQDKIRSILSIPSNISQAYRLWQVHAYEQIQAFENDQQVQLQMKMLNYDRKLTEDIVKRGNIIIADMKNSYTDITTKVQEALTSLSIIFDPEIEKRLEKLVDNVIKRRRNDDTDGLILSSDDLLLEDTKADGYKESTVEKQKSQLEDPILDLQSNCSSRINALEQKETPSTIKVQPVKKRRSLGQQLLEISMQQPAFFNNDRDRICSVNPPEEVDKQRSTLAEPSQMEVSNIKTLQDEHFVQNMRKRVYTTQNGDEEKKLLLHETTSNILPQPNQNTTNSSLRAVVSPDKLNSWPSIRSILSPTKYKDNTAQGKIKRVLSKLKLPEKYQKIVVGLMNQTIEVLDLSNCSIDQLSIICIIELLKVNKSVKSVKLIRNRLTDDFVERILPFILNVTSLNLSQNYLTERSLDAVMSVTNQLPVLRSVIMSQNRIREKICKGKLQELKKMNITITI